MRTALTIGFVQLDINTLAIPPQLFEMIDHYWPFVLIPLVWLWIRKDTTVKQASAEGIDRPSYPPE